MTLKSDERMFCFKNDQILVNFDPSTFESQKFAL